jgi:putative Mg2+ transporter-C (MgtC) family protein
MEGEKGMDSIWHISNWDLTLRLLTAALLGGLVGLEREWNNHSAGLRTHILVCIGSAAIVLLSIYGFSEFVYEDNVRVDPARLAAQVISGIGFLGAGTIMRTGFTVSGLTTAASIWVVAAIGLCAGAGFLYAATLVTVMVLVILFLMNKMEKYWMSHRKSQEISFRAIDKPGVLGNISSKFGESGIQIVHVQMKPEGQLEMAGVMVPVIEIVFSVRANQVDSLLEAIDRISLSDEIMSVESKRISIIRARIQGTRSM